MYCFVHIKTSFAGIGSWNSAFTRVQAGPDPVPGISFKAACMLNSQVWHTSLQTINKDLSIIPFKTLTSLKVVFFLLLLVMGFFCKLPIYVYLL